MRIFIATSDAASYILTAFAHLADKYIPEFETVNVLGYGVFPELPERYKTISLASKQNSPIYV